MRFLVDECAGPSVAKWLQEQGHDVLSVYEQARGVSDDAIVAQACSKERILIACELELGARIHREGRLHAGIVLLRLEDQRSASKIEALQRLLGRYEDRLADAFIVVTERRIRLSHG